MSVRKLRFIFTRTGQGVTYLDPAGAPLRRTLPSRGLERGLVPAARFDKLLSRAVTVGVSVGHRTAQLLDARCVPCGLPGSLVFPAVQVVFGGLAGGEE